MAPGTGSTLRDEETFPAFTALQGDWNLLSDSRHWCFLGEIETYDFIARLVIHVRDRAGQKLLVALYTNDKGALIRNSCIPGHTVAVLYAQQRKFMDGSVGIRVEDIKRVRVCCVCSGFVSQQILTWPYIIEDHSAFP